MIRELPVSSIFVERIKEEENRRPRERLVRHLAWGLVQSVKDTARTPSFGS